VLVSLIAQSYASGMDPEYQRVRFVQRMLITSVLHLVIVAILAPGLSFWLLNALSFLETDTPERALLMLGALPWLLGTVLVAYPFSIPLAVGSLLAYLFARPVRRMRVLPHLACWTAIGLGATMLVASMLLETALHWTVPTSGAIAGVAIGLLVWSTWRTVDLPAQSTPSPTNH
jgi:hypothetical protein